jgi:Uma2 family endonuclease
VQLILRRWCIAWVIFLSNAFSPHRRPAPQRSKICSEALGYTESVLASVLIQWINNYLDQHPLGACAGEHGICKLLPGLVRAPDVSFISREQLAMAKGDLTFAPCAPLLCVEVWSKGNTRREIDRKIKEYFQNGARLVWELFPRKRAAAIYHSPTDTPPLVAADHMYGENVLPGFSFLLEDLYAAVDRRLEGCSDQDGDGDEQLP